MLLFYLDCLFGDFVGLLCKWSYVVFCVIGVGFCFDGGDMFSLFEGVCCLGRVGVYGYCELGGEFGRMILWLSGFGSVMLCFDVFFFFVVEVSRGM